MKTIRLHEALITPGYFKSISFPLDLSEQDLLVERRIYDAAGTATMEIRNSADIVTVRLFGEIGYKTECDRCLEQLERTLVFDYTKDVKKSCNDDEFDGIMLSAFSTVTSAVDSSAMFTSGSYMRPTSLNSLSVHSDES